MSERLIGPMPSIDPAEPRLPEPPLNVRVALALGCRVVWTSEGLASFLLRLRPESVTPCCGCAGRVHAPAGPMGSGHDSAYPLIDYDTDDAACMGLIKRYGFDLECFKGAKPSMRWNAYAWKPSPEDYAKIAGFGPTPNEAVCNLVLALAADPSSGWKP